MDWMVCFLLVVLCIAGYLIACGMMIEKIREYVFLKNLESVQLIGRISRRSGDCLCGPRELVFHVLFKNGKEGQCKLSEDHRLISKLQSYQRGM